MKKITGILILIALFAIVVVQLMNNKNTSKNRVYNYDKEKVITIHSEIIKLNNTNGQSVFTGTFDAIMDARINADLQGKITHFYVDAGSVVKKGTPLVKLDNSLLQLQLESVEVQIEGFEADEKRYIILTEADAIQGIKLEKTQMALKSARIQRNTLLEKISKTTIKAPFSGIVTMKMSEVGSFAAPGVPLLMLTDISNLKFIVNVSESDLGLFNLSQSYPINVDAYPNLAIEGTVVSVGSKGNMGNSFPIQFEMKNTKDLKIKSKMFGKVAINGGSGEQGIVIPSSAIVGSDLSPKVYIIKNNKAVLTPIIIAKRIRNNVVVAKGLTEGDEIVVNGFINLFDGANVEVKK